MSNRRSRAARHTPASANDQYASDARSRPPTGGRATGSVRDGRRPRDAETPPTMADRLRGSVPAAALLPLRFFLGGMFLYAGLDKLLDPVFLRSDGPGSIAFQLQEFARVSPLAPLVTIFAEPFPVLVGFGIALLEIAIGLGAILGLLYRWSALAGAGLSILFFLTASWTTRPYYLGPDLPYALGWITLAAAGAGGVLTVEGWLARRQADLAVRQPQWQGAARWEDPADPGRRAVLQLGVLAAASVGVATLGRAMARSAPVSTADGTAVSPSPGASLSPGATAQQSPSAAAGPSASPGAAATAGVDGTLLGTLDQLPVGQAGRFRVQSTGDPAVIVRLPDGTVAAYDAVCTHEGCTVGYDAGSGLLLCPCHGAAFDPAHHAEVVGGPTNTPLPELPIKVDQATGRIYLQA
jgi:thiosulfate dehydrogenase [quinone] large subunit